MPTSGNLQFLKQQDVLHKLDVIEGMNVASLGCGNLGYFIIPMAKAVGKNGKAYAVDILKSALENVRSKARLEGLTNFETVWADLEKVGSCNIPAGSLDVAALINVLFQNKDHASILKEAIRLLKNGGKLIIIDWKKVAAPFGPAVDLRIDPQQVKNIASQLKLNLIEETSFGDYFWGLIFKK